MFFLSNPAIGPGTGTYTTHYLEIIFMFLLASLIGLWLGYALWGKYKIKIEKFTKDLKLAKSQNDSLSAAMDEVNTENKELKENLGGFENKINTLTQNNNSLRHRVTTLDADLGLLKSKNESLEETMQGYPEGVEAMPMGQMPSEIIQERIVERLSLIHI